MILRVVGNRLRKQYNWDKDTSTVEWCERNVYMHSDASPLTGSLRFNDTPHLIEVLNDHDRPEVWKQLLNFSTQTGKTLALQCAWAKSMSTDPTRMQWSIKNDNDLEDYLEEKIMPFVRGVPVLSEKLIALAEDKKKKTRAKSLNVYGGGTTFTGTTDAQRRSKSVKYIFMDEIALYGKGHFLELEGRTKAYERHFRKVMAVSSRKSKGDEMDDNYSTCETKKEWQTWCSSCDSHFYATHKNFKFLQKHEYMAQYGISHSDFKLSAYTKEAVSGVHLECPNCGYKISNAEKDRNILNGKYRMVIVDGDEKGKTIGYLANALAVRITSFENIATLWINAEDKGDPQVLHQLFIDYFNEFYEKKIDNVDEKDILLLGNGCPKWEVPEDTIRIYMGVDTQKDHFWWEVKAYGYGKSSHSLAHGRAETFDDLEKIWEIGQNLVSEHGEVFQIDKLGIDRRGYNQDGVKRTDDVDQWVRKMIRKWRIGEENRVYATEGEPKLVGDAPFKIRTMKDETNNRVKVDIKVMKLSNIYLKTSIRTAMSNTIEMKKSEFPEEWEGLPKFFVNQTTIDADAKGTTSISYTRQITAEVYDYEVVNGKASDEKTFINPKQADNHIFDTSVICEAFAQKDQIYMETKSDIEQVKDALKDIVLFS